MSWDSQNSNLRKIVNFFNMFGTHPDLASWCHVHSQITKKTTLESALQFNGPYYEKVVNMTPKLVPRGLPKSIKNLLKLLKSRSGPQGVLLGVLGDLRIIKMLPRGTQMHPQDIKMTNYSIQWET